MSTTTTDDGFGVFHPHTETWLARRESRWRVVMQSLEHAQAQYKATYDKCHREFKFQLEERVLLDTKHIGVRQHLYQKSTQRWQGPYPIVQVVHEDIYRLDLGPLFDVHCVFHVSKLKKFHEDEQHLHDDKTLLRSSDTEDVWGTQLGTITGIVNKCLFARKGI